MASANTVSLLRGAGTTVSSTASRGQILTATGTGTTETVFTQGTDSASTTTLANLVLPQGGVLGSSGSFSLSANPAILNRGVQIYSAPNGADAPYFSAISFDSARPFKVKYAGTFTSGVAANDLKIGLYNGTSATVGSDSAVFVVTTGTAGNFGAVSGHFYGEVTLIWDSTSGKADGFIGANLIAPSGVAATSTTGAAIAQFAAAAVSNLNFLLSYKWNASNAANTVSVSEFSIEQL